MAIFEYRSDGAYVRDLIVAVAEDELLPRFSSSAAWEKADGSLLTEADLGVQRRVREALMRRWPSIPLLGEESSLAEQQRLIETATEGFWCLDPLDGTSNFVAGIPFFALSLAYIKEGRVRWGAVYDPVRREYFHAQERQGAWLNDSSLRLRGQAFKLSQCMALVDFKRLSKNLATRLAVRPPYRSQRSFGSVALDWCWMASGRCQLYLHGGQKLWDFAAGTLILEEAGGRFCSLGRGRLEVLSLKPTSAVAGSDEGLLESWLEYLTNDV